MRLGARRVPVFRSAGIAGFHAALLVALVAGFRAGVNPVAVLGLGATAGLSFFAWALLRRSITGRESLVLLEHVWVAGAAVAAFCAGAGVDVLAGLDVLACALTVFLAAGRVGCLAVGCCPGVPAPVGVTYPPAAGLPPRLTGVPLLPVQLIEAVALILIGVVSLALAGSARPGAAAVWFLLAYAVVRFGLEALRGDDRGAVGGLSVPRWACLVQVVGAAALSVRVLPVPGLRGVAVPAGMLVAAAMAGLVRTVRRRAPELVRADRLDETWSMIERLARMAPAADRPVVETTGQDVRYGVSLVPAGVAGGAADAHVSASSDRWSEADLVAVADALAGSAVRCGERAVHFRIAGARLGLRPGLVGAAAPARLDRGRQEYFGAGGRGIP
jgi:hypothetical protein